MGIDDRLINNNICLTRLNAQHAQRQRCVFSTQSKMLACTEMITMCLQSAKRKHLLAQQQPLQITGQGLPIFHDIFRRADKNDDGKLTFEEFNTYFADSILTTEELQELFCSIDGRQNDNLDTEKLSDYFAQHLGGYVNVLSALESLNIAILKAMDKTKEEYQGASVLGQFVTRFMLRETSSQLLSLQRSLQYAMEAVEEQSCPQPRKEVEAPAVAVVQKVGRRCGRRANENRPSSPGDQAPSLTTGVSEDGEENWCSQISRLQQLLDKLECQSPKLEPLKEDSLAGTYKSNLLLVQRQVTVAEEDLEDFQKVLKSYSDATAAHSDNLHMSVQKLPEKSCYIMYEFWQDRISWMSYLQSNSSKDFQRCVIQMLVGPEVVATMLVPASWWIMTNNNDNIN
ncbi:N-terminal EF-hand calcium-binding protein 1 isoform X1 [Gadus morhua]|uniref:N-terminal EF-hand calcium binding protein 3 n=2 Tax=Gadus morhua TaxID=8049 RepID=A0A8C4YUE0_GADMO|nr:N-terminal EF-hand calcium-binding protein 1-like isoform X1 [Gadus morhua]